MKINLKNQATLAWAAKKGIILDGLITHYGMGFTLKLIKSITRKAKGPRTTGLLYPKTKTLGEKKNRYYDSYIDVLENSGFKLKRYKEDFIDEDSGEVVVIERIAVYFLGIRK